MYSSKQAPVLGTEEEKCRNCSHRFKTEVKLTLKQRFGLIEDMTPTVLQRETSFNYRHVSISSSQHLKTKAYQPFNKMHSIQKDLYGKCHNSLS